MQTAVMPVFVAAYTLLTIKTSV